MPSRMESQHRDEKRDDNNVPRRKIPIDHHAKYKLKKEIKNAKEKMIWDTEIFFLLKILITTRIKSIGRIK